MSVHPNSTKRRASQGEERGTEGGEFLEEGEEEGGERGRVRMVQKREEGEESLGEEGGRGGDREEGGRRVIAWCVCIHDH